jgi:hypothetical protein
LFKFKAFGETIEISPSQVAVGPVCFMVKQPGDSAGPAAPVRSFADRTLGLTIIAFVAWSGT